MHLARSIFSTYPALIHGYPLCCRKPLVIFNVIHSVLKVSITLGQVHLKYYEDIKKLHQFCTQLRDLVPAAQIKAKLKFAKEKQQE